MQVDVEIRLDGMREEEPRAFFLGNRRFDVEEILDRWPSADCTYFKVRVLQEETYILRHIPAEGVWEIIHYQSAHAAGHEALHSRPIPSSE